MSAVDSLESYIGIFLELLSPSKIHTSPDIRVPFLAKNQDFEGWSRPLIDEADELDEYVLDESDLEADDEFEDDETDELDEDDEDEDEDEDVPNICWLNM